MNIKKLFVTFIIALTCSALFAQTTKWRDIHTAKKKETIFGIARQYNITIDELLDANPEMRKPGYELKKGSTVFIPFEKPKPAPQPAPPQVTKKNSIDVGILLPLHDVDGDGRRMVEYYRGVLMAVEKMKNDGININVKAWNVPQDADIDATLKLTGNTKFDVIFGPLYTRQVKAIGDYCSKNGTRMVIPFSINGNEVDVNKNIYQVYQNTQEFTDASIKHFLELFSDAHPVIIDCNDTTSQKGIFTFALRKELEKRGIEYSITNLNSTDAFFAKAFSLNKRNVVILNTGRSPELTMTMKKLDALTNANRNVQICMYGYIDWLMYQRYNQNQTYFCKYDAYIPSTFYYNFQSGAVQRFETQYNSNFSTPMMNALPHFAMTGYDQAIFFIGGLHKYGSNFSASRTQTYATPLQTPYNFIKTKNGGYRNKAFMLIHFKKDGSIDTINY